MKPAVPDSDAPWAGAGARPSGPASSLATAYRGWWERSDRPVSRWEPPTGAMVMIVSFGPTMRVTSTSGLSTTVTSFVVGMFDEPALTEHDGHGHGVQINLTAEGAYRLFGGAVPDLSNRIVHPGEVCNLDVDRLINRVLATSDPPTRFAIVEDEVTRAAARGPALAPEVAWVDARLRSGGPQVRIGDLAEAVGWPANRLAERYRRQVGLPPKTVALISRFQDALGSLRLGSPSLAQLAAECGYADEAHFNRDFRRFTAHSPTEFLAAG